MPRAEVTYNAGATYRVKGTVFKQGVTQIVTDPATLHKCRTTAGFCVHDLDDQPAAPAPKTVKKVKKVVKDKKTADKKKAKPPTY